MVIDTILDAIIPLFSDRHMKLQRDQSLSVRNKVVCNLQSRLQLKLIASRVARVV